jgi:hypothetical protein
MTRFAIDPNATQGVKMEDGTVYRPSKRGSIDVDSRAHASQIRSPNAAKNLELIVEMGGMPKVEFYRECSVCLFAAWDWSTKCSRCGEPLDESDRTCDDSALATESVY